MDTTTTNAAVAEEAAAATTTKTKQLDFKILVIKTYNEDKNINEEEVGKV